LGGDWRNIGGDIVLVVRIILGRNNGSCEISIIKMDGFYFGCRGADWKSMRNDCRSRVEGRRAD
jgi:hypothetical protein